MPDESPREHIERIRREKFWIGREEKNPLEPDLRAAIKNLAEELNTKESHFILELLQNAEDNAYPQGVERVLRISVTDNDPTNSGGDGCLCLLNNEVGFAPNQVESLCSVGRSTKDKSLGQIGEKGIGFKSVFRVSHRPHIFSKGYQFHFQSPSDPDDLGYIVPRWIDQARDMVQSEETGIFLPLVAGKRVEIARKLQAIPPETILFLTKLHRLSLGQDHFIARDTDVGLVRLSTPTEVSVYFVHRRSWPKPGDWSEEKRTGLTERDVKVALPLKSSLQCLGRVFAFLPTEVDSGLPFLVNADFLLISNREKILVDREWNNWLRNCVGETLAEACLKLLTEPAYAEFKADAYRFVPLDSDLNTEHRSFFEPVVAAVQRVLSDTECVLVEGGELARPDRAFFASAKFRELLATPSDSAPRLAEFTLVAPELERHRARLQPLGVRTLATKDLLCICNDPAWLVRRDAGWWEKLLELLSEARTTQADLKDFPLLLCADAVCRQLAGTVFFEQAGQPVPEALAQDWPPVNLLNQELQARLEQHPAVWSWLERVASLQPFSVQTYITAQLLGWCHEKAVEGATSKLMEATRYIVANFHQLDEEGRDLVGERMPWLQANERALLPQQRGDKQLAVPKCIAGEHGWPSVFPQPHFFVLHDDYCAGLPAPALERWREVFKAVGITEFPLLPQRAVALGHPRYSAFLQAVHGVPSLRDWECPTWLRALATGGQLPATERQVRALENWLRGVQPKHLEKALWGQQQNAHGHWESIRVASEFGEAIRMQPWLRTSQGFQAPTNTFLDTSEIRDFFGNSVPYVSAGTPFSQRQLELIGVRTVLNGENLVGKLRDMSRKSSPDLGLLEKLYRRLQDLPCSVAPFRNEKLVFLQGPDEQARWASTNTLVWEDAGAVFDEELSYVSRTYGNCELRRFFTEKLGIPSRPSLEQFAGVWQRVSAEPVEQPSIVEEKMKRLLKELAPKLGELRQTGWWAELKRTLKVWTVDQRFEVPSQTYAPDDADAVRVFGDEIRVAYAATNTTHELLRELGCRSLRGRMRQNLAETASVSPQQSAKILTPAAKELCALMLFSQQGAWRAHCDLVQMLFQTKEATTAQITVEYSLADGPQARPRRLPCDAFWDKSSARLLLRDGLDLESWRDAAAKSFAAAAFGVAGSVEKKAEFFLLLTVSKERGRNLVRERGWQFSDEQCAWLCEVGVQTVLTVVNQIEAPPETRPVREAAATNSTNAAEVASPSTPSQGDPTGKSSGDEQPGSVDSGANPVQSTGEAGNNARPVFPGERSQETPRPATPTTIQEPDSQAQSASASPPELHDPKTIRANLVEVRAHTRSAPRPPRSEQSEVGRQASTTGLASISAETKADLEGIGREFAANELRHLGYEVEPMGQQNPGFDLRGYKPGHTIKVEVKSHAREASSVFVTKREREEYDATHVAKGETWELWNVENVAKSSGNVPTIQRIGHIPDSAWKESGYWLDLSQCSQEPLK